MKCSFLVSVVILCCAVYVYTCNNANNNNNNCCSFCCCFCFCFCSTLTPIGIYLTTTRLFQHFKQLKTKHHHRHQLLLVYFIYKRQYICVFPRKQKTNKKKWSEKKEKQSIWKTWKPWQKLGKKQQLKGNYI